VTARRDAAWLDGLAATLTEVDEFLRSPAGHAALEEYYRAPGSTGPGFKAGNLIDEVSFTALDLRERAARQSRRS